ncbi:hypothetical protein MBLNU459_g6298t2 [Dothideomycetes sp. NU459]
MSSSDTAPPDMNAAAKTFFSSPRFAVAGASSDPSKFGHKITPLNPSRPSVSVSSSSYPTVPDPAALANPSETGLSVITPPAVTRTLLREAKDAGVRAVFLQPGSFDDELLEEAKRLFPGAAVGGFEGGTRGGEGWCVLVDGEAGIRNAGRKESGKL